MALPKQQPTSTVEDERLLRKQRLAAGFRIWGRLGYDEGPAGHITARDPERSDHFWVNPFGKHFSLISVSDLLLVNHHGEVVEGDQPVNRAAFAIHSAIHAARPDVVAAAHCHSVHGKAWSSLGRLLDPITQDACSFYDDHALFDDFTGVVLDVEEGKRIAHALGGNKWFFVAMNRSAHAQLLAEAAGKPHLIDHENATLTRGQVGSEVAGWFSFQPMFEWISKLEPDLFD